MTEPTEYICEACSRPLPPKGRNGPRKRYCGPACYPSARSVVVRLAPEELDVMARLYQRAVAAGK